MDFEYENYQEYVPTTEEVWEHCVFPSLEGLIPTIKNLIILNIIFNIFTQTQCIPETFYHSTSGILGLTLLFLNFPATSVLYILGFTVSSFCFLFLISLFCKSKKVNFEYTSGFVCFIFLVLCEFYLCGETWIQLRGFFMVACMKIMSLSSDFEKGNGQLSFLMFFGYIICPANCLFGPWIPVHEYQALRNNPWRKNFNWAKRIIMCLIKAIFFLSISNCWGTYFIPDGSLKWLEAYRKALSFRTSHYFVCYLSEMSMMLAGFNDRKNEHKSGYWSYDITHPLDIEFPTSLVSVVISWNIPMHKFLKNYVYRAYLQYGRFKAILLTYFISSLLHGFNVEVAAVLLTIGIYSYIQLVVQEKLSSVFDACLKVRPCRSCKHKYTRKNIYVKTTHLLLSFLTIFHLIYLGILMDSVGESDRSSVYEKWAALDFLSHWVMLFTYIISFV